MTNGYIGAKTGVAFSDGYSKDQADALFEQSVDSVSTLRASSFPSNLERLWLSGYYGQGTPGGNRNFYRVGSGFTSLDDNGSTEIVDADGVKWKAADLYAPSDNYAAVSLYVDSANGDDANSGAQPSDALQSISEAAKRIPVSTGAVDFTASNGQDVIVSDVKIVLTSSQTFQVDDLRLAAEHLHGLEITTSSTGIATIEVPSSKIGFLVDATSAVFDNVKIIPADTSNRHKEGIRVVHGGRCRINSNCTLEGATDFEVAAYHNSWLRPGGTYNGIGKSGGSKAVTVHSGSYMVNSSNTETVINNYSIAALHDRGGTSDLRGTVDNCGTAVQSEDGANAKPIGMDISNCDVSFKAIINGFIQIASRGTESGNAKDIEARRNGKVYDFPNNNAILGVAEYGEGSIENSGFDIPPTDSLTGPGRFRFGRNTSKGGIRFDIHRGDGTGAIDIVFATGNGNPYFRFVSNTVDAEMPNDSFARSGGRGQLKHKDSNGDIFEIAESSGATGGTGTASSGAQYVELTIGGVTYKVLHDGTV